MAHDRRILLAPAMVLALLSSPAGAQVSSPPSATVNSTGQSGAATPITLPEVEVVGATPLLGSGVDRNKVPAQTQVLTNQDITATATPTHCGH